jgi:hypothetical protein
MMADIYKDFQSLVYSSSPCYISFRDREQRVFSLFESLVKLLQSTHEGVILKAMGILCNILSEDDPLHPFQTERRRAYLKRVISLFFPHLETKRNNVRMIAFVTMKKLLRWDPTFILNLQFLNFLLVNILEQGDVHCAFEDTLNLLLYVSEI